MILGGFMMRLNYYLPQYHFVEKHIIVINSSPKRIYKVACNLDMSKSKVIKTLFALRGIYALLTSLKKQEKQSLLGLSI